MSVQLDRFEGFVSLEPGLELNPVSDTEEDVDQLKSKWTSKEDEILISLVKRFGKNDWEMIASLLPGRTAQNCKYRFTSVLDPELNRGTWTKEEDDKLIELVSLYGEKQWSRVAKHLKSRRGKQCRERWHNHLDPSVIKTPWTKEEDLQIIKSHCVLGTRWAQIAKFLPGRTDNSIKNHWYATLKRKMDKRIYKMEDIDFSDLALYLPIKHTSCTSTSQDKLRISEEHLSKVKQIKTKALGKSTSANSPPIFQSLSSPSESRSHHSIVQPEHKEFVDAMLQMIAEDMLPLTISEGSGFRKLMILMRPQYPQLSQRTLGFQLYNVVEKTVKPQLIQQLKNCVSLSGGLNVVHITADIWASECTGPLLAVHLHFLDNDWNIYRPLVAFRSLQCKNFMSKIGEELESILLSFGLFPHNIGYSIIHEAKNTIATHNLFCDYKIMCSVQKDEPDEGELLDFLDDQVVIDDLSQIEILSNKHLDCITTLLHCVIKEAMKKSVVVEHILYEVQTIVSFFCRSVYWNEVLEKNCRLSLTSFYISGNFNWNSTFIIMREIMKESVWSSVMSLLDQARAVGKDCSICPPVVQVTREQVVDFVCILEPFEEAIQILQDDDITVSLIIPSIIGLDNALEAKTTKLSYFCSALRSGLRAYFQPLIFQKDLIVASVLDPRIKLQPFNNGKEKFKSTTLFAPSNIRACSIVKTAISKTETITLVQGSSVKLDNNCIQLNKEVMKESELDQYLSEPLLTEGACILKFWREATRFPRLQSLCCKLLAVPASSGGFKRLFPLALRIVRARTSRLPDHTTEQLLLYREYLKKNEECTVK